MRCDTKDVECPYCGEWQDICHDDGYGYDENEIHRQECSCGKTFAFTTRIETRYSVSRADCMNGGNHQMKKVVHMPCVWPDWVRCQVCGMNDRGEWQEVAE